MKINTTIIVTTLNSQDTITTCLDAIKNSDFHNYKLIVIDNGSNDKTIQISRNYTKSIYYVKNSGSVFTREFGFSQSKTKFIINIDSDILISRNAVSKSVLFLSQNPEYSAVTGILDKKTPITGFFSQYKNLYMHYILTKSSSEVNYIYGSFFAIRKSDIKDVKLTIKHTNDTELGQWLSRRNKKVKLLKSIKVKHLKNYTFANIIKNDFKVPFEWAQIFLLHNGWKQFGKNNSGFAHASKKQILSLFLTPLTILSLLFNNYLFISMLGVWTLLNYEFFKFIFKEKGNRFLIQSIIFTFFDNLVMLCGIVAGSIYSIKYTFIKYKLF